MEYSDYSNVFLVENVMKLLKNTRINKYAIKLEKVKQLPFDPTYSLGLVELETLKIYIKVNLVNNFIYLFKSLVKTLILFDRKPNKNFCLYVDYWDLNNITIKN